MTTDAAVKVQENRVRRMAQRQGFRLEKSRRRDPRAVDYGWYRLVDARTRFEVFGSFALGSNWSGTTLDEIEAWLTADDADDGDDDDAPGDPPTPTTPTTPTRTLDIRRVPAPERAVLRPEIRRVPAPERAVLQPSFRRVPAPEPVVRTLDIRRVPAPATEEDVP